MATEQLLRDFPPIQTAAWEAAIARDLKGADYEKKLVWRTEEGLAVKPYYRAEDLKGIACPDALPGIFPFRRGNRTSGDWQIREDIELTDTAEANAAACAAVAAGAEGIAFSKVLVQTPADLGVVLASMREIPVRFHCADQRLIHLLLDHLSNSNNPAGISTGCDPLTDVEFSAKTVQASPAQFVPFTIHAELFEEGGATAIEEIGLALAAGVDFLGAMDQSGVTADCAANALEFSFALGGNYFFDIAKLRAFRMVWARVVERFGGADQSAGARISARTSGWNQTVYDPYVNILRATTEAMSAVLGGADSVTIAPYDACYKQPGEASQRLARNTQLLLKHEAWLGRVADAAGGSYYVEAVTDHLAREAWKLMQQIETRGGYREAQAAGAVSEILQCSLAKRELAVKRRQRMFIGTNQFANPSERALERVDANRVCETARATRAFDRLRLRTERHAAAGGKVPRVLLAEIGDARMRAARSNFAASFFTCAGFDLLAKRFKKAEDIAAADTDLIVLCSADTEYSALAPELILKLHALGRATPVIIAGNPENSEELRRGGIADFVHLRSDAVEMLTKWQDLLGIKS
jgi:methylmalonyl-CoA mutase